jgi:uncharacterized membrane protein YbhN (UPF0104 family)
MARVRTAATDQAPPAERREPSGESMPDEFNARHLALRLLALAVLIGLVATAVLSLPGLDKLRGRFSEASPWLLVLIGLLKLGSCLSDVFAFREVFCPNMPWSFSYRLGMTEQAANVLIPAGGTGGLAFGAWALRQAGMATDRIARRSVAFFVLTSIPNFACAAVVGPLLLIGVLNGKAPVIATAAFSALAWGSAVLVAELPRVLRRIDRLEPSSRIGGWLQAAGVSLRDGISDVRGLLAPAHWRAVVGAAGYLGFDIAAMVVGFAAFGGGVPLGPLIFGYVIGQLGGLIPLPAGIGGTEGGLIGALVLFGSPLSQAAAAVLTYRAFQLGVPALFGAAAFIRLRSTLSSGATPAADCN